MYVCEYLNLLEILTVLYESPGFATMQQVECIDLVHIQAVEPMVTDMMMIVMEAGKKIEMAMVMERKENGAIEMMIDIVVMEIVMAEIMRIVMAGMVTEMTTTGEEAEALITNMTQEAGALIEIVVMMMDNTHLGTNLYDLIPVILRTRLAQAFKHLSLKCTVKFFLSLIC